MNIVYSYTTHVFFYKLTEVSVGLQTLIKYNMNWLSQVSNNSYNGPSTFPQHTT